MPFALVVPQEPLLWSAARQIVIAMGTSTTMNDDGDGTPASEWEAFLFGLPPSWRPVALAFDGACGIVEGNHEPDGGWTLTLSYGLSDVRRLLRAAPVGFTAVEDHQEWWLDQHLESECGLLVAKEGRAFISWSDNFAAGVNVRLCVCATADRYASALAEAERRHADVYGGDEHHADDATT